LKRKRHDEDKDDVVEDYLVKPAWRKELEDTSPEKKLKK